MNARDDAMELRSGPLQARFLPRLGMLGASLRHDGVEVLRQLDDLATAAARGTAAGIPLLHPWANRLDGFAYTVAGRTVELPRDTPLLHYDRNGLPIHGVPWSRLAWTVRERTPARVLAGLAWDAPELRAVFPFPHRLELEAALTHDALEIATTLLAGDAPVPASFGFHPYVGLAGVPRAAWHLRMPPMRRMVLDARLIPTGEAVPFAYDGLLADTDFDDLFAFDTPQATLSIAGGGQVVAVECVEGYTHAQVYAPPDRDLIALEPMTAPGNALVSHDGLRLVPPGGALRTVFRIRVGHAAD